MSSSGPPRTRVTNPPSPLNRYFWRGIQKSVATPPAPALHPPSSSGRVRPRPLRGASEPSPLNHPPLSASCTSSRRRRAALWPGGGRGDEGRPLDLYASGVRPAADLPGVALRSLQRLRAAAGDNVPGAVSAAAGRSARPRTTSWSATFAGCSKRRPFMAKGTGRPGRSSGSRESALRRNGCAG